jgi:hypothetical protein
VLTNSPAHGATWAFAPISAARVRALLEVRAVTDPPWPAAGNHRNRTIVLADLGEREIAPSVGYGRNVLAVVGSCNEFRSEQFFVTEKSTRFEGHGSGCDSVGLSLERLATCTRCVSAAYLSRRGFWLGFPPCQTLQREPEEPQGSTRVGRAPQRALSEASFCLNWRVLYRTDSL